MLHFALSSGDYILSWRSSATAFWPRSFLGRDHLFSGPHDGCGECDYCVAHIAVSRRVCPEVPSNRGSSLLSKLGISHQAPTVHWRLSWDPQPTVSSKMTEELDGCGHNVVVRNGKDGRLGVHLNLPYESAIAVSH